MHWVINPQFAFFNDSKIGYIFDIPNNEIKKCTLELIDFVRKLSTERFTYKEFCKLIGEENESLFENLKKGRICVEDSLEGLNSYQNTMFNSKFVNLANLLTFNERNKVIFLGFPYDLSVTNRSGTKFASKVLREVSTSIYDMKYSPQSYSGNISSFPELVYDIGDISGIVFDRNGLEFEFLKNIIFALIKTSNFPIVLGGDHSISFATISGASVDNEIGIIHIDAHDDFYEFDLKNWSSKLHHGNYLGALAQNDSIKKVYCLGLRAFTPTLIKNDKVEVFPEKSIFQGIDFDKNLKYYITLDIDVIDPLLISGVGTPVPFGFDLKEIKHLLSIILKEVEIIGLDIVEFIPDNKIEALTICSLIFYFITYLKFG